MVVAGTGPAEASCGSRRAALRLGAAVAFAGFVADADLAALVAAADCAVVPSLYEPFGMVALEAGGGRDAGGGRGHRRAGGDRRATGGPGVRFPAGDPAALADAVSRLLADPELGRRLVRAGQAELAAEHGWARVAERTVAVYRRAVGETPGPPALAVVRPACPPRRRRCADGNLLTGRLELGGSRPYFSRYSARAWPTQSSPLDPAAEVGQLGADLLQLGAVEHGQLAVADDAEARAACAPSTGRCRGPRAGRR